MRYYMEYIKLKRAKRNKKFIVLIIIGVLLILISLLVFIIRYRYYENKSANDRKQVDEFLSQPVLNNIETNEVTSDEVNSDTNINDYIAVLEIPAINLTRGLVDKSSPNNDVNKNIYMLKDTVLPDEDTISHIILASHSGNSYVSYFKNLHKLDINDEIYFYYKNSKYIYSIYKIDEVDKTGNIELKKTNSSDITLITCKGNLKRQIVIYATLKSKGAY